MTARDEERRVEQDAPVRQSLHLAYVPSRFPLLTETFILREICEMRRRGFEVHVVPLVVQRQPLTHPEAQALAESVVSLSLASPRTWAAAASAVLRRPVGALAACWQALWGNRTSPAFLLRAAVVVPKALAASRWVRLCGVDHLHVHYATHSALMAWLVWRLTGVPYSITIHSHDIFVDRSMLETKLRDARFLVTVSHYNRDYLRRVVGDWAAAKTRVVRCGIEVERYRPAASWPGGEARLEILSIGSLEPWKGYGPLLEALALLVDRGLSFRCRIVGAGSLESDLRRKIREGGLADRVELMGARPQGEVAELLGSAHCYVQPSVAMSSGKREGLPVSLMEALACELPTVASDLTGIPELVRPADTGTLVPVGDAGALADAIEAIASDYEAARERAARGRRRVLEEYDIRHTGAALEQLIREHLCDVSDGG